MLHGRLTISGIKENQILKDIVRTLRKIENNVFGSYSENSTTPL